MSMRLTTIVKPPSIIRVELMKRRGIMPTLPMAMLATHGNMQRKLVNITLRNTARKNKLITVDRYQMDWNRVEGNWKQLKGKVKEKWGKLTDGRAR